MRLIDADLLKSKVPNTNVDIFENCRNCSTLMDWEVKELIDKMPTIDAVEVVRCKDCRWGHLCVFGQHLGLDGFCSKGERKEQKNDYQQKEI